MLAADRVYGAEFAFDVDPEFDEPGSLSQEQPRSDVVMISNRIQDTRIKSYFIGGSIETGLSVS